MANQNRERLTTSGWVTILGSFCAFFLAGLVYHQHWRLETGRAEWVTVPWHIALVYRLGGVWVVTGLLTAIGVLAVPLGIRWVLFGDNIEAEKRLRDAQRVLRHNPTLALKRLRKLIERYPDTPAAEQGRPLLAKLQELGEPKARE